MLTEEESKDYAAYIREQKEAIAEANASTEVPTAALVLQGTLLAPLIGLTGYLCVAPVDPIAFATLSRSCVKMLGINIGFAGGVHLGLAATQYEAAATDSELLKVNIMIAYSYMPSAVAYFAGNALLFANPLT